MSEQNDKTQEQPWSHLITDGGETPVTHKERGICFAAASEGSALAAVDYLNTLDFEVKQLWEQLEEEKLHHQRLLHDAGVWAAKAGLATGKLDAALQEVERLKALQ